MYTELAHQLQIDSRLEILPVHLDRFSNATTYSELVDFLRSHPEKPGVLIFDRVGLGLEAILSHQLYTDPACKMPGTEPAHQWLQAWNTARPMLLLALDTSILTAYTQMQRRPAQALYEPIAIETGRGIGLIEARHLLLAHAQIVDLKSSLPGERSRMSTSPQTFRWADRYQMKPLPRVKIDDNPLITEIPADQTPETVAIPPGGVFNQVRKLEQRLAELQERYHFKDAFFSTVSHELRAPVANMRLAIQLLRLSSQQQKRDHYLNILESECGRARTLIDDLLDLQQLEQSKPVVTRETIVLDEWLPPLVSPFQLRAESRRQSLSLEIAPGLPALVTDRRSLERILVELLNNACKYTPPAGNIAVHWRAVASDNQWPVVELSVRNSGSEIPLQELPHIFDRFYRIPGQDIWQQGGSGLGLALVKKLVEQIGGSIRVESHSGETAFLVSLP